jgi:septal ring factor EnvC (AmiA/AmiB activator)
MLGGQRAPADVRLDVKRFRGLLPMPAAGDVAVPFGDRRDPRFGTVLPHHGWDVAAGFGEPVFAVFDGRVVWAAWFRGYGLMVVLDHGGGVHSVYGHLSVIAVAQGDDVAKGQPLGRVGDTGPLGGASLYFEMREAGRATDPAAWIAR